MTAGVKPTDIARIEALEAEFDLLCLGRPSPWRIAQALAEARP